MYDVMIIGAGVVGGMIARELSRFEISVLIVEKESDVAMGATRANSGIVHAGFDAKVGSLKAKLNVRGSEMMEDVCQRLGVKYKRNGSMVIGFGEEDERVLCELLARGEANGVNGLSLLSGDGARAIEPALSENVTAALLAESGGIVCPYELCVAAIGNAMDNGVELMTDFQVTKIDMDGDCYTVYSGKRSVRARYLINSAGLYSDEMASLLGITDFKVTPRRGEYMLLDKACGGLISHTIFRTPTKMGKGILISPTVDGNILLGPTSVDIGDKESRATTNDGIQKIIREARENVPKIDTGMVITSFSGLRSTGNTGDFIIRRDGRAIHLIGIESPGLTASVAIGEYVLDMLRDTSLLKKKKDHFIDKRRPMHRFRAASIEEKNEIIKSDPSYGKIVCRCESISEGEIIEAIRTNPKPRDLDGVKRRTRAQMGRCQGGFCSPTVAELLAKELKIPMEEVTKFGGGSKIVVVKTK